MIELNRVVHGIARFKVPLPADRDTGVEEVVDVVVEDAVLRAVPYPDSDRAHEEPPGSAYFVVRHRGAPAARPDLHAAPTQVRQPVAPDVEVAAAFPNLDAVAAHVLH